MTSLKESDSIQVAKQKLTSIRQNINWETMKREDGLNAIDEVRAELEVYYKIRGY